MNTRSTRRSGGQEADRAGDVNKDDELVRPSIKSYKRSTNSEYFQGGDDGKKSNASFDERRTVGLGDSTKVKSTFSDSVASKHSPSESKRKVNFPKSSTAASLNKSHRESDVKYNHSDSGGESDNEEEKSEEELEHTSASDIHLSSYKDYIQKEEIPNIQPSTRLRKVAAYDKELLLDTKKSKAYSDDAKSDPMTIDSSRSYTSGKTTVHKFYPQQKKAYDKELLLDTKKSKAYSDDEDEPLEPQRVRGRLWIPITVLAILLVVFVPWRDCMLALKNSSTHKAEQQLQVMKSFQDGFRKLPIIFSGQSQDLWQRSQRMLELQLRRGNENVEPAIILLTAAQDAAQVLHCVGDQLAKTYASTLNSSYTVLSGLNMTSENSEEVKMYIDQRLSAGFQANHKVAVLHRLESLPPGSLTILYKYCDHENAAFKNVALVLTVLLKNSTLQPDIKLNELEETVYDFFKATFINQGKSGTSHNEMNGDKLGGVWSRISHVVLPVFPEKHNVKECGESKASP